MNKRITALIIGIALIFGSLSVVAAEPKTGVSEGVKKVSDAVVLYKESCKALVFGEPVYTDTSNKMVVPKVSDGVVYVPVRFVCEAFGGTAGWNKRRNEATFSCQGAEISTRPEKNKLEINGETEKAEVKSFYDRIYLPVETVAKAFSKKVSFIDAMIIIGSKEEYFQDNESEQINEIYKHLAWQRPDGDTIVADFKKTNPNNAHPRVLCNVNQWDGLMKTAKKEKILSSMLESYPKGGELVLDYELPEYVLTLSGKLLDVSREVLNIAERLAMQYRITGDKRYAEKAWEVMECVCNFPDWNNNHWLDTAEMAAAVSIMFDWCYDALSNQQRSLVVDALKRNCLEPAAEVYSFSKGTRGNNNGGWVYAETNWSAVCNGGVAMAAIAVMGEDEESEELALTCLEGGLRSIENMLVGFGYDGAWVEGPYLGYLMKYYAMYMSTLESGLGTDYGYFFSPGVPNSIYFLNYLDGAVETFNYSDSGTAKSNNIVEAIYFAKRLCDKGTAGFCYEGLKKGAASFRGIIWYPEGLLDDDCLTGLDKDKVFETTGVISTRSEWYDENGISLLAKGGTPNVNHGHSDIGTFVIDCKGERFFSELGADSYNLEKYIGSDWYYRKRAEGHNTIVINPEEKDAQNNKFAPVVMKSKPRGSISVIDMQPVYDEYAESMKRGFMFTDNRQTIVIRDEIKLYSKGDIYWFAHTPATIELVKNFKGAILTVGSQKMYAELLTDGAKFSVMEAEPLSTSPQKPLQTPNPDYKKLTVYLEDVVETDITVILRPINSVDDIDNLAEMKIGSISEWEIPDGEIPSLSSLRINGKPFKDFKPEAHSYNYELKNEEMPKITAKGATVTMPDSLPGTVEIKVGRGDNIAVYRINLTVPAKPVDLNGGKYIKYKAAAVNASEVPEPANGPYNVVDGKKGSRWSASGKQWIEYDLGDVKLVGMIGLGWYLGDGRNYRCRLEYSEDGQRYTTLSSFETSGTTNDVEYYEFKPFKARYIKLNCSGCQDSDWNSLDEFEVYSESK